MPDKKLQNAQDAIDNQEKKLRRLGIEAARMQRLGIKEDRDAANRKYVIQYEKVKDLKKTYSELATYRSYLSNNNSDFYDLKNRSWHHVSKSGKNYYLTVREKREHEIIKNFNYLYKKNHG